MFYISQETPRKKDTTPKERRRKDQGKYLVCDDSTTIDLMCFPQQKIRGKVRPSDTTKCFRNRRVNFFVFFVNSKKGLFLSPHPANKRGRDALPHHPGAHTNREAGAETGANQARVSFSRFQKNPSPGKRPNHGLVRGRSVSATCARTRPNTCLHSPRTNLTPRRPERPEPNA